ncbi:MAG TPA: NADH-quinone oxidoreductase subunit K [Candidatus Dormibacteraeota bacterium]|nr:NADH-quinone oxidoreductase subunit K [Candidatus Dormibacteraeota bacterium]
MTVGLVSVLFVGAALIAAGALAAVWRRDVTAAVAGLPLMFAGAGVAFVGVARFAAAGLHELVGQEMAILLAIASLALVTLGLGLAGRESPR